MEQELPEEAVPGRRVRRSAEQWAALIAAQAASVLRFGIESAWFNVIAKLPVHGVKTIEKPTPPTHHRGPPVIHAGTSTRVYLPDSPACQESGWLANAQAELDAPRPNRRPRRDDRGHARSYEHLPALGTHDSPWAVRHWC